MRNLVFPRPGAYRFVVDVRNEELVSIGLNVDHGPVTRLAEPVNTLEAALQTGFQTFTRGDVAGAAAIFLDLATRFPGSPDVQNNLGFTLLAQGQPQDALDAFHRAANGGYRLTELLNANIACCQFLLGNHENSLELYLNLLKTSVQTLPVILFLLGRTEARPVILESSADYLALVALNAGRSAVALGQSSRARQLADIAQAGLLTFSGPPGNAATFEIALAELRQDVIQSPTQGS